MGSITVTQRFRIAKTVPFRNPRWLPRGPSWNSSNDIFSQTISQIEPKLDGRHWSVIDIQNCLNRSVPISKMAAIAIILKFFKLHLLPNHKSDWAKNWWKASERHRESGLLKLFPISKMAAILNFFKRHLLPNRKLDWAETWWEASERHRDLELLKLFRLAIQDGRLAILKIFKQHLLPNSKSDWTQTWGRHSGHMEIKSC